jgi:hypothetical protein
LRLRICRQPTRHIDGVAGEFRVGVVYDVGPQVGGVLLAEGWAEPEDETAAAESRLGLGGGARTRMTNAGRPKRR